VIAAMFFPLTIQDQRTRLAREPAAAKRNFGSDVHFRLSSFEEERGRGGESSRKTEMRTAARDVQAA